MQHEAPGSFEEPELNGSSVLSDLDEASAGGSEEFGRLGCNWRSWP